MEPPRCRILVMASGSGSNFQALCDAVSSGRVPDSVIIRLIVNRKQAYATHRAERLAIPWDYFNLVSHGFQAKSEHDPAMVRRARDAYDAALAEKVLAIDPRPDLIVLAGWMHIFSDAFLNPVAAAGVKVINLHPALPGKYDGAHAIQRAFADFQAGKLDGNKTGIMVHHVTREVDQGEAILTREVVCLPDDTLAKLTERIQSHEHDLIVEATAKVAKEVLSLRRPQTVV